MYRKLAECSEIMGPKWLWVIFILGVIVLELGGLSNGCWEQERLALLQLKPFFPHLKDEGSSSNCCQWEWVECNVTTRRVTKLSLNNTLLWLEKWYLNVSLFLPFEELKSLYLTENFIVGCVENEGFGKLSKLRHLEILDLSSNNFNDSSTLLSSLSKISSLKSLSLAENLDLFTRSNHTNDFRGNWLSRLSNLKTLDLSRTNMMNNFLCQSNGKQSRLINLEELDLSGNLLSNSILTDLSCLSNLRSLNLGQNQLNGSINIKEFFAWSNLETLDMSYNQLEQFVTSRGNGEQARLNNLEVLDLSFNSFGNSILANLSGFSNLKSLSVSANQLKGSIDIKEFCAWSNLESLDMGFNEINQFVTSKENRCLGRLEVLSLDNVFFSTKQNMSLGSLLEPFLSVKTLFLREIYSDLNKVVVTQDEMHVLSNVEDLILDGSPLDISFLQSIGSLTSLKTLSLRNCDLTGTLPAQGWCYLKNLQELDLGRNALGGDVASCLGNLTSLHVLDISKNQFIGNIAPLTNLTKLQYLSLSKNYFQVSLLFQSFANYSDLKFLLSDGNKLVEHPAANQTWSPKFQLKVFRLSYCRIEERRKLQLPNFLYHQYDLRYIDLSHTNYGGIRFPNWLIENNPRLESLYMTNCSIVGPLSLPSHPNYNLTLIDISDNKLQHQIPPNFCSLFPNLERLFMSRNAFNGSIPLCFGGMRWLSSLDISHNQLFGRIPKGLAMIRFLLFLRLSNNSLSGPMFPAKYCSNFLTGLYLDGNKFNRDMPQVSPISSTSLNYLDLSDNHLFGKLPIWLGNHTNLLMLALSNNQFEGPIPRQLCNIHQLDFLDLSQNNLVGTLPSCFNLHGISHVHLRKNKLSGSLPNASYGSSSLVSLDLSENNFTENISDWIAALPDLSVLLLKANQFHGEFPMHLCKLSLLSILDLSQNKLSGPIPSCLGNLTLGRAQKSVTNDWAFTFAPLYMELVEIEVKLYDLKGTDDASSEFADLYSYPSNYVEEEIVFSTKKASYNYTGNILDSLSGIDLSCNKLTGIIPQELGNMSEIYALNLSHNSLIGPIPSTFSKLKQIESLDLSYNNLNGRIPSQLTELSTLEVFTVAYNNLSGPLPDMKAQFGTFDERSYEGNPLLCGPPLKNNCSPAEPPSAPFPKNKEQGCIDMGDFYISFVASYVIILLATAIVLYINPYWRRAWFHFIEEHSTTCYYFIVDNLHRLPYFKRKI